MQDSLRQPKKATKYTKSKNKDFAKSLPVDDGTDAANVARGFIATRENPVIEKHEPNAWQPISWDLSKSNFVKGESPETVNPSLWRQAGLNAQHGLYEICEDFYQVRGFDTSNATFIRGNTGWIVIDPLTTAETAAAAYELVTENLGFSEISAVIYTHSHLDHYGGILGMLERSRIEEENIPIVAPEGFLREAVAENVIAAPVMGRRATYQFGMLLPWSEQGHVDQGLGKGIPTGSSALVPPTIEITETGQELTLDGVKIEFQLTPESEAPAEMHFFFPEYKALCMAENCSGTMHNILTLRGALVRDSLQWSKYIDEALERWGDSANLVFASHGWPHWGKDAVRGYLTRQRDLYRWLHDQAMRLANLGYTPNEIAAEVTLPPGLWDDFMCHGYYGTVSHNVRAVYQRYIGFYDGHPSSLDPHTPVEVGKRYVDFMGGIEDLLEKAKKAFKEGDYKWVAEVLRHAVFANPENEAVRLLQADAFEQLAYQAESGPWRDIYLTGAQELRNGSINVPVLQRPRLEVAKGMTLGQIFDFLAVKVNGNAAVKLSPMTINWSFSDTNENAYLELSNGTLHSKIGPIIRSTDLEIVSSRDVLEELISTEYSITQALEEKRIDIEGNVEKFLNFWETLTDFPLFWPIIEP
ncbi:MAG: alkyl sulfatase dimerization domain-containing protein [Actinomycetota bacterium]|nr:MBL fold metallo-hydrolase [Acidimicrobiales bacterium]MEC7899118.1 alkyl sulfatase dimerization domain-containing protein [Actinomycetota bacterium]|tara:strand:+ start:12339 stop:14261 length:1923 start_codon:yes stop_codon:yes gene_type:complete